MQTKCDQCGKYFEVDFLGRDNDNQFFLKRLIDSGDGWRLCSPSCLSEKAWELREQLPKLSKTRIDDAPA